jgi:hypothetical protein
MVSIFPHNPIFHTYPLGYTGVGDDIRGTFMGAIDTAAGQQGPHGDIAARGRMEVSQGMAKLRGATAGDATGGGASGKGTEVPGQRDEAQGTGVAPPGQYGAGEKKGSDAQPMEAQQQPAYQQDQPGGGPGIQQTQAGHPQQPSSFSQDQPGGGVASSQQTQPGSTQQQPPYQQDQPGEYGQDQGSRADQK